MSFGTSRINDAVLSGTAEVALSRRTFATHGSAAKSFKVCAATDDPIGIVMQDVVAGKGEPSISVGEGSMEEVLAGAAFAKGAYLRSIDATGRAGTAYAGQTYCARALEAATAANQVIQVVIEKGVSTTPFGGTAITADGSIAGVFPEAGTYFVQVSIVNTTANAVTGGLNLGTTEGGDDVAATLAVGANAKTGATATVVTTAAAALYIAAETAWNSASVLAYVTVHRLA